MWSRRRAWNWQINFFTPAHKKGCLCRRRLPSCCNSNYSNKNYSNTYFRSSDACRICLRIKYDCTCEKTGDGITVKEALNHRATICCPATHRISLPLSIEMRVIDPLIVQTRGPSIRGGIDKKVISPVAICVGLKIASI